jgi:hypothetical protein
MASPDYARVARVLVGIVVRLTSKTERKEPKDADRGVLPGVDRGTSD